MTEIKDRRAIRFSPDRNTLVWLTPDDQNSNEIVGLAVNESYKGVSAIFLKNINLRVGQAYLLKVGSLAAVKSELRWMKDLDTDSVRVGLEVVD